MEREITSPARRGDTFPTLEAFYSADERRRRSGELDFGVWWRDGSTWPTYRVSWIEATGELYAIAQAGSRRVEVLGHFGARGAVEAGLRGWANQCGGPNSLAWVRRRARGG
jgi:hypothetical protein